MKINLNKVFILTAVLVLLVGLSTISATDADQNTTSISDNHADIQQVTTSHVVKEDTNTVSTNEKTINSDKKINAEKKSEKALKSSQEINYYVSNDNGADSNTGTSTDKAYKTINQAISQATSNNNIYNIHIKEGTYTGSGNTNLTVDGNRHINFIGDGVNRTVLDGQVNYTVGSGTVWGNDPYFNPYTITYGNWGMNITNGNGHITIQNMNIQNMLSAGGSSINAYPTATVGNYGNLSVDNVYFYNNLAGVGAGIRNNNGATLTVTDSVFEANRKSSTTGNFGAGIYNNGTADIYNTLFIGNIARWGTVTNDKLINITNCTFHDGIAYNAASTYKFGSGIATNTGSADYWNSYNSTTGLVTNVINSTFINNQQTDIYQGKGNLLIDNCNFENSTGVYIAGESVNNASLSHVIKNSNFNNMIGSTIAISWGNNKNITFAIYNQGQSTTTIIGNNITTGTDAYALYLRSNNNVTDNHINGYVNIIGNNNTLTNNTIITANRTYTVEITGNNNSISNNYLEAAVYKGDESVKGNRSTNTISDNGQSDTTNEIRIDEENYAKYFDTNGNIIIDNVTNGTTVRLGQLSGKQLKIDNVNIYITSYNSAQLTDCSIKIGEKALVTINGLNINNTDNNTVITLNSQHNTVESNTITTTATNPIKINANHNEIKDNTITANANEIVGILVTSANNNIEENNITVNGTGLINAITITGTTDNTIINNKINTQSTENTIAININKADKNTIRNNNINIKTTNNATAINIEESDENMINSPVTINSKTAQAVTIQNSNNNTLNGITTDITATKANAITLYKANNTLITANDTTNIYTINATTSNMINIEQSNNTEISYITPRIYGSGTVFNITGSYNTTIEAVNYTNTTLKRLDNQQATYAEVLYSNGLYIGKIVRDNFIQTAIINTTARRMTIKITNTTNIEINSMEIYSNAKYVINLINTTNTLIINNTLRGLHNNAGDNTIDQQNTQNTTLSGNKAPITTNTSSNTILKHENKKIIKTAGDIQNVSVNNYDDLRSYINNSTAETLIINLNEPLFNPLNPEEKSYRDTQGGLIIFSDDVTPKNIIINGNNQDVIGMGKDAEINDFIDYDGDFNITVNNLTVQAFGNMFGCPIYGLSGVLTLVNVTMENCYGYNLMDGDSVLIVDNCKITIPSEGTVQIITHNSSINLQAPGSVVPGSGVLINGTLLNDMGGPGKGLNVTLFVDGDEVANVTTDDNGKFNYTYTPKSIKSGINVTARFNGTDYHNYGYNASEGSITFDVAKISTNITVDTINTTTPEENITITGKLLEKNTNNTLGNSNLTIVSDGKTYDVITDENGIFSQVITSPSTTGTFNVTVSYNGSDMYDTSSTTVNYTVRKISTNLTVDSISTVKVGSNITVTGKLLDETNTALANTTVIIITGNTTVNTTTDDNGLYTASILANNAGLFNITLSYPGNNKYTGNNVTTNYTINKLNTTATIDSIDGVLGRNVSFTAYITDENNQTVTGGYVIFKVNGVTLKDENNTPIQVNVVNGTAVLTTIATWSKAITTTVAYSGSDNYNKARIDNGSISIAKQNATVNLTINENIKPGENLIATVNITDAEGNIVNAGTVIFKINGKTLKDENNQTIVYNVTNGQVTLNYLIPSSYSAKNYTLTAVYGGSIYNRVQTTQNFTITKLDSNVALNVTTSDLKPGSQLIAVATVTDANDNPVTRGHLTFKLNDKTITDNDTRYVVNMTNGVAVLNYCIPSNYSAKTYKLSAVFGGSNYNTNEAAQNITLSKINTNIITQNITITNNTLHVQATINNAETTSIANERTQKVSVKLDKHTVIKEVTVQDGVIDVNTTLTNVHSGKHTIEIVTSGNSIYKANRVNVTVATQ